MKNERITAGIALIIMLMIFMPKTTVMVLLLSAALSIQELWQLKGQSRSWMTPIPMSIIYLLITLAGWALLGNLWHFSGHPQIINSLKMVGIMGAGLVVLVHPPRRDMLSLPAFGMGLQWGIGIGVVGICLTVAYAFLTGQALWGSYSGDPLTPLNNSAVILSLFLWPALYSASTYSNRRAIMLAFAVIGVLAILSSLASLLAAIIGLLVVFVRSRFKRRASIAIVGVISAMVILVPYVIKISGANVFEQPAAFADVNSPVPNLFRTRLAIWGFTADKIDMKPWLGWGFDSSRDIPKEDHRLSPSMEIMPLHPHNMSLQMRLELGVPGVSLLAAFIFLSLYWLAKFTDDSRRSGFALAPALGWLFIANVSFGMWQTWWMATAFLLVIAMHLIFLITPQRQHESPINT